MIIWKGESMRLTLKEWRRVRDISQERMAEICDVHVNTYRIWERDPMEMKVKCLFKIMERLRIDLYDIDFDPERRHP